MTESIQDKYARLRPQIKNGSIILVRGHSILTKIIEWSDKAYYSHALVVFEQGDRLLAIESMAQGVRPDFLSSEVFANDDFCILNPKFKQDRINAAVDAVFDKSEAGIPYATWELPKILLKLKFNIGSKNMQPAGKNICSVFAGITYGNLLPFACYTKPFMDSGFLTPQDLIRFASPSEVEIIGDDTDLYQQH